MLASRVNKAKPVISNALLIVTFTNEPDCHAKIYRLDRIRKVRTVTRPVATRISREHRHTMAAARRFLTQLIICRYGLPSP
jgi:hypothetical protein